MAKSSNGNIGGIIGLAVGFVVVAGIAGSGLYLRHLQTDAQRVETSVATPVEQVRRVILNLNEELAAVGDAYASVSEDDSLNEKAVEEVLAKQPDLLSKEDIESLNQTSQMLSKVQSEDSKRGTVIPEGAVVSGKPAYQKEIRDLRTYYQKRNKDLMQEADTALSQLSQESGATNNLEVNRIKALYSLVRGRIEGNRAAFEQLEARWAQQHASRLAPSVSDLRSITTSVQAAMPETAIVGVEKLITSGEAAIKQIKDQAAELTKNIADKEERLAELENSAREAREKMTKMETAGDPVHEKNSTYAKLAKTAREDEAQAEALRNGTLVDATLKLNETEDLLTSTYEGGHSEPGLRDLKAHLASLDVQIKDLEGAQATLVAQRGTLQKTNEDMRSRKQNLDGEIETGTTAIRQILADADKHATEAQSATDAALKLFVQAEKFAKAATSAAGSRARDARSAAGAVTGPENERLTMVAGDGDMEASAQCLLAEISYDIAMARARQINLLQEKQRTATFVAAMTGADAPASVDAEIDPLRTEALDKLAAANKAYEEAAKLIRGSSFKGDAAAIAGKDYEWQVQVGQAAVHLLQADLAPQADEAYAQKTAAYDLLKTAVQGREQSPLLSPAIDMLVYLQKTAK